MTKPLNMKNGTNNIAPQINEAIVLLMKCIDMTMAKLWASKLVEMINAMYTKKRQIPGGDSTKNHVNTAYINGNNNVGGISEHDFDI